MLGVHTFFAQLYLFDHMGNDGILGIAAIKLNLTKFKQRFWLINLASTGCGVIKRTSPNALNQRTTGTINSR